MAENQGTRPSTVFTVTMDPHFYCSPNHHSPFMGVITSRIVDHWTRQHIKTFLIHLLVPYECQ